MPIAESVPPLMTKAWTRVSANNLCDRQLLRLRRFDPLWNSLVIGGLKHDGTPFLGTVGMIGTAYTDVHIATGKFHIDQAAIALELHARDVPAATASRCPALQSVRPVGTRKVCWCRPKSLLCDLQQQHGCYRHLANGPHSHHSTTAARCAAAYPLMTCQLLACRVWQLLGTAAVSGSGGQAAVHGRGIGHEAAARCPQGM